MADITGKVVVVTAAAQGIGRASALAFAKAGAIVHATDINETVLAELSKTPGIKTRKLDVLSDAAVKAAFAEIGRVDVLFNCAGFVHAGSILEMKDADLDFAFDLNVKAMIRTIRAVLPGMIERGGGAIVNMSSVLGQVGTSGVAGYAAAKHGVVGLTQTAAIDYAARGIRINAVGPGYIDTPLLGSLPAAARDGLVALHPIGRLGRAEEVAELVVWLSSDRASFVTGAYYPIDGGYLAR
jgi:2-keto-3-deoxy-L-fuconate dehydrogenase